jgi:hypothetical protein
MYSRGGQSRASAGQIRPAKTFCPARGVVFLTYASYSLFNNVNFWSFEKFSPKGLKKFLNGPWTKKLPTPDVQPILKIWCKNAEFHS